MRFAVLAVSFSLLCAGCAVPHTAVPGSEPPADTETVMREYRNSSYGVRIEYPADWSMQQSKVNGFTVVNLASPRGHMRAGKPVPGAYASLQMIETDFSRDVVFAKMRANTTSLTEAPLLERTLGELGGEAAILEHTEGETEGEARTVYSYTTVRGGSLYSLQLGADPELYDAYAPLFRRIAESVEFMDAE